MNRQPRQPRSQARREEVEELFTSYRCTCGEIDSDGCAHVRRENTGLVHDRTYLTSTSPPWISTIHTRLARVKFLGFIRSLFQCSVLSGSKHLLIFELQGLPRFTPDQRCLTWSRSTSVCICRRIHWLVEFTQTPHVQQQDATTNAAPPLGYGRDHNLGVCIPARAWNILCSLAPLAG